MLTKLLADMQAERAWLEREVFESAPTDWAGYQARFGEWKAVTKMIDKLERLVRGEEEVEDDAKGSLAPRAKPPADKRR